MELPPRERSHKSLSGRPTSMGFFFFLGGGGRWGGRWRFGENRAIGQFGGLVD